MILLSGHSLTHDRRVPLEALSLSLKERESTATMTPASMTGIGVSSWFLDDTEPGRGIVWRVKSLGEAYTTNTPTLQLEHVINTLRDRIMFGEITPATITGNSKATSCTAEQAVRYILSYQGDWVLGSFGYSVSNPYKFDGDTLFDALETVTASLPNACWTYDMSAYPFRLNIVNKDSTVGSELRAGRNLKTITKTIDKSSMYTRFYPIGKDDLHIAGNYVERNANAYGVIEKVETDASIDTEAELRRWANERLDVHAEPNVTIDVEGYELANATGESLDRMVLGRACRVPLPEYGTTIQERIVTLTYPDKVHQPDVFKATLANNREDVTKIIADNMKKGGKGGRTSTKQSKEDHAWFEDTNNHVAMCAIGIIGVDAQGNPNWTRLSRLEVNENGIYGEVKSVQGEVEIAKTRIDMNEEHIILEATRAQTAEGELSGRLTVQADKIEAEVTRASEAEGRLSGRLTVTADAINAEVTRAKSAEGTLSGRITVEADRITQEVTRATTAEGTLSGRITVEAGRITQEVTRATNAESGLSGRITTEANRISLVVEGTGANAKIKPASIVASINEQTGQSKVTISADQIDINGIVNKLTSYDVTTESITTTNTATFGGEVECSEGLAVSGDLTVEANVTGADATFDSVTIGENEVLIYDASVDGNTLTIEKTDGTTITFSKATTLTGAWSSGTYTVTASPQGNTRSTTIQLLSPSGEVSVSGKSVSRTFTVQYGPDEEHTSSTGFSQTCTIDATDVYNAGMTDYYTNSHGYWKTVKENNGTCTVPNVTNTGSETWFTMTKRTFAKGYNTDDTVYYGKLYNSSGTALTGSSYFWYGLGVNLDGANPVLYN